MEQTSIANRKVVGYSHNNHTTIASVDKPCLEDWDCNRKGPSLGNIAEDFGNGLHYFREQGLLDKTSEGGIPHMALGFPFDNFGGWNESVPHSLVHLNTSSPVGSIVWGGLEGMALPEEVCHWGQAL